MRPGKDNLQYCIMRNGQVVDGAHGLAIGATERDAWERAVTYGEDWEIERAKENGVYVRRCALMVVNPDPPHQPRGLEPTQIKHKALQSPEATETTCEKGK